MTAKQQDCINEFIDRTGEEFPCAIRCLKENNWDVEAALVQYDFEAE